MCAIMGAEKLKRMRSALKVIDYYASEDREHWLAKIAESDWVAGRFLHELLKNSGLQAYSGENTRVLLLTEGEELVSFCTLSDWDDIHPTELTPWVGFVYTFPQHRGKRCVGRLMDRAAGLAKKDGFSGLYVCTDQAGIYEKYGFEFKETMTDRRGGEAMVYVRSL